jgi:hypothetical protein
MTSTPANQDEPLPLPDAAKEELKRIATWLESAPFTQHGDFEQCCDNDGLLEQAKGFLQSLALSVRTLIFFFQLEEPSVEQLLTCVYSRQGKRLASRPFDSFGPQVFLSRGRRSSYRLISYSAIRP